MLRLRNLVVLVAVVLATFSQVARADEATTRRVVAGLMVLNALRGVSDSELLDVGRQLDEGLVRQYGTTTNGLERTQRVVNRLEPDSAKRPEAKVLNAPEVNAMAVPGHVYVTSALVGQANDDQLAGVMGHELSHIEAGHCRRAINRARIAQGVGGALYLANANQSISTGVSILALAAIFDYSRGEEYEADKLGAERAAQSGYAYDGLASFLERGEGNGDRTNRLLVSHPRTDRRVNALRDGSRASAGTVRGEVVPRFSVSITGFAPEEFRRGFQIAAEAEGQPVDIPDWGGDYRIVLTGSEAPILNVSVDASRIGRSGYARGGVSDIIRWQTIADIRVADGSIGSESADATGVRAYLHLGTFSQRGTVSLSVYNSWLGQSLQGETIRALVPQVLHRLQEEERLRLANQPRRNTEDEQVSAYTYTLLLGRIEKRVTFPSPLEQGQRIKVILAGRKIGEIYIGLFDFDPTRALMLGDVGAAQRDGVSFIPIS